MKKLLLFPVLLMSVVLNAQDVPPGFYLPIEQQQQLPLLELATFDHHALLAEDQQIENDGGRTNYGRRIFMDLDGNTSGTWQTLPNGDRIWQLRFRSAGALAVNIYFDQLYLPVGSMLSLYSADRSYFEGPFYSDVNGTHGHFSIAEVFGDEAIIEYYEPYGVVETPSLGILAFGHFYRYIFDHRLDDRGGSEACEVNVNCPEGFAWQAQRDAVVRLQIPDGQFVGLCTGSLVNTTAMDCRKYVLTALHCAESSSDADLLGVQVKFNYERTGCTDGSFTSSHNLSGVIHLADSNDGGGQSGSDFLLVELEDEIPDNWDPFFAGWDATGNGSPSGVTIHHPAGDIKKISTYDDPLSSVWIGAPGSHWEVEWVETITNWGVTEGGSSGSPLYTNEKLVVGTLTGGGSFCNNPDEPDYYGKMSKHFDANPNIASQKLRVWLDPEDTGQNTMFGAYMPCNVEFVGDEELSFSDIDVYPTAGTSLVNIHCHDFAQISEVRMFDGTGKMLRTFNLNSTQEVIDIASLASGFYYLTFVHVDGNHSTRKITRL